jgi:hypothetical protein
MEKTMQPINLQIAVETDCRVDSHQSCSVCSDSAAVMTVVAVDLSDALCVDNCGNGEWVAMDFVPDVAVGETVLVHGGVAIGKPQAIEGSDQ